jgi:TATA-box binding protein (TBP) (component of TFIID and TFIIIB)
MFYPRNLKFYCRFCIAMSEFEFGKLYVDNVVSQCYIHVDGVPSYYNEQPLNIKALTCAINSKMSVIEFPASFSKFRTTVKNAPADDTEQRYPLKKKYFAKYDVGHVDKFLVSDDDNSNSDSEHEAEEELGSGGAVSSSVESDSDTSDTERKRKKRKTMKQKEGMKKKKKNVEVLVGVKRVKKRMQFMAATIMVYDSHEIVIAGGKSVAMNIMAAYMFARRMSIEMGVNCRVCNFVTRNIVFSARLGFSLNLDWIAKHYENKGELVIYTPEEFAGLCIKGKPAFMVFTEGKVICVGNRTMEDRLPAEKRMHQLFDGFKTGLEPEDYDKNQSYVRDTFKSEAKAKDTDNKKQSTHSSIQRRQKKIEGGIVQMMRTVGKRSKFSQFLVENNDA